MSSLHLACEGGHTAVVELLLPQPITEVSDQDDLGRTALQLACFHGHLECAQLIIDHIQQNPKTAYMINMLDRFKHTALMCATAAGQVEVCYFTPFPSRIVAIGFAPCVQKVILFSFPKINQ